jgi:RND superfamily putative drug exporter
MFRKIAQATVHHPKIVLVTTSLIFIVAGVFGTSVIPTLSGGGYSDQASDSAKVWQAIADDFKVQEPNLTLVLGNPGDEGFVDKPETLDTYNLLLDKVQSVDGVSAVNAYWTAPQSQLNSQLKSKDASLGLVLIYFNKG